MSRSFGFALAAAAALALGIAAADSGGGGPAGLPPVPVPADNPLTPAKVALGEKLFFEPRLSGDGTLSCASCHRPEHYFTDGIPRSAGVGGQHSDRNSSTVLNAAYAPILLWDGRSNGLEDQVRYPVTHPREMNNTQQKVVEALTADPAYPPLFAEAFGDGAVTWERVARAIASFERTLVSGSSPFDRHMAGDAQALSAEARRGFELFRGKAGCVQCHQYSAESPFFSDFQYHNTGIGWAGTPDLGRYELTKEREDKGRFRTPSLRNIARTAPYMHDGQMATLQDVVAYYARGGEPNPFLDEKVQPLELSEGERADLVAFLESLTGEIPYRVSQGPAPDRPAGERAGTPP